MRQRYVPYVVVEMEVFVIDPNGRALERNLCEPLAVAWYQIEPRSYQPSNRADIDTVFGDRWAGCEDCDRTHVHVRCPRLQCEE